VLSFTFRPGAAYLQSHTGMTSAFIYLINIAIMLKGRVVHLSACFYSSFTCVFAYACTFSVRAHSLILLYNYFTIRSRYFLLSYEILCTFLKLLLLFLVQAPNSFFQFLYRRTLTLTYVLFYLFVLLFFFSFFFFFLNHWYYCILKTLNLSNNVIKKNPSLSVSSCRNIMIVIFIRKDF
jgi:hypothetical protein